MGKSHDAMLIQGDGSGVFQVDGLATDITAPLSRIENRRRLSDQLRIANSQLSLPQKLDDDINRHRDRAFSLLRHNAGEILDLQRESASLRDAYGQTSVGQCLLMARRMIEAGVSLVTVNWEDETKISGMNTCWDTHEDNFNKLKTLLCPIFDQAFPTFCRTWMITVCWRQHLWWRLASSGGLRSWVSLLKAQILRSPGATTGLMPSPRYLLVVGSVAVNFMAVQIVMLVLSPTVCFFSLIYRPQFCITWQSITRWNMCRTIRDCVIDSATEAQ